MPDHLSAEHLEGYRQRTLAPRELLAADDHLAACEVCRQQLRDAGTPHGPPGARAPPPPVAPRPPPLGGGGSAPPTAVEPRPPGGPRRPLPPPPPSAPARRGWCRVSK